MKNLQLIQRKTSKRQIYVGNSFKKNSASPEGRAVLPAASRQAHNFSCTAEIVIETFCKTIAKSLLHLSDEAKRGFSEPKKLVFERFGVHRTYALQIFGGVHARRQVLVENQYADTVPVPEGSQLFQRLELFDGGGS